jgi:hypothetical protein
VFRVHLPGKECFTSVQAWVTLWLSTRKDPCTHGAGTPATSWVEMDAVRVLCQHVLKTWKERMW